MSKLRYTTIHYQALIDYEISCNEYVILDTVHSLCRKTGWCTLTRENMAINIGATKRTVINIVDRLIDRGFLTKNNYGALATTDLWIDPKVIHGEEISPSEGKNFTKTVKKLHQDGEKTSPNNNIYNNSKNKYNVFHDSATPDIDFEIPDLFPSSPVVCKTNIAVAGSKEWKELKFEDFWERYKKKKSRDVCLKAWLKLSTSEIEKALLAVDDYVIITPVLQYRKLPITWINQKCWDDDMSEELKRYRPNTYTKRKISEDNEW